MSEPTKNARHTNLPQKLRDMQFWIETELALPEEDQVSMSRLDCAIRSFLGEFTRRATDRARRSMTLKVMTETAQAAG